MSQDGNKLRIAWGARAIGELLSLSARQAFHLLEIGALPDAKKVGGRWALSHQAVEKQFLPSDDSAAA
jgi:hypothetical protein